MEIDVPEYNVNTGLRLCWCDGYSVKISTNDNEVIISANREGLVSLVNHLLNLAQKDVPCGTYTFGRIQFIGRWLIRFNH